MNAVCWFCTFSSFNNLFLKSFIITNVKRKGQFFEIVYYLLAVDYCNVSYNNCNGLLDIILILMSVIIYIIEGDSYLEFDWMASYYVCVRSFEFYK